MREILLVLKDAGGVSGGRLLILGNVTIPISETEFRAAAAETDFPCVCFPSTLTAATLGEALGFEKTATLDISGDASIRHDLQEPAPAEHRHTYDVIIDAGVLFWCVNPGLALNTVYEMLKPQGRVVHITAVSGFYGRGYYNVHPRLFEDFYALNECRFILAAYRSRAARPTLLRRALRSLLRSFHLTSGQAPASDGVLGRRISNYGRIHLGGGGRSFFEFSTTPQSIQPAFIPNEIVGVMAFQKGAHRSSKAPVLT